MAMLYILMVCNLIHMSTSGNIQGVAVNKTLTLGYIMSWTGWEVGKYSGSSIIPAIAEVERRQLLPGYTINWVMGDTACTGSRAMKVILDMWNRVEDMDAIIGADCSSVCINMGLLAAAWNIPMVSWGCASTLLWNKKNYPTFARSIGPWTGFGKTFDKLADTFGWSRIGILADADTGSIFNDVASATVAVMSASGKTVIYRTVASVTNGQYVNQEELAKQQNIMRELKDRVRIIFLLLYANDARVALLTALDLGMLNEDYVFIGSEVQNLKDGEYAYRTEDTKFLTTGLLSLTYKEGSGPEYEKFAQEVIDSFEDPIFDQYEHLPPTAEVTQVEMWAGLIYDAVLIWAYGVNKTLEEGYPPDDGIRIARSVINTTFQSVTGKVSIDEKGDRYPDLTVVIVQDDGNIPLLDWISADGIFLKRYKRENISDWSGLVWYGNSTEVPKDSPPCGWSNELCSKNRDTNHNNTIIIIISIVILVSVTCGIIAGVMIKKRNIEAKMNVVDNFLVNFVDIEFPGTSDQANNSNCKNIGVYKNNRVWIKYYRKADRDVSMHKVMDAVKTITDMNHENLIMFTGICIENANSSLIFPYLSKSSIYDVMKDGKMKLTNDFKISFVFDILNGLKYLHRSSMGCHGKLRSTKCLLDRRWTCKITLESDIFHDQGQVQDCNKLLWTAPELLRDFEGKPTKAGDVYSFSIILQEILMEEPPFDMINKCLTPDDILEKITEVSSEPFRPEVDCQLYSADWIDMMRSCWNEDPNKRPSVQNVFSRFVKINKNRSLNLVDNMLKCLEQHNEKMEERVLEKTAEIRSEKNRMEILLSELLPAKVATDLIQGHGFTPEAYECVTVFFSDIVGFTAISSEATPIDIVVMLNNMYSLFDNLTQRFDVYKVATIGDAYMVASGVPIRNENRHATEICRMAVALLKAADEFTIPHRPGCHLHLRIGIHSGPCVAGVAGMKMPRYLLFGETVFVAAIMESSGESMQIHVSQSTKDVLDTQGSEELNLKEDKVIDLKGETIQAYWLTTAQN